MMLTTDVLILPQILNDPIESVLSICNILV